eukprot:64072-Hanusia_phi.AAC.1
MVEKSVGPNRLEKSSWNRVNLDSLVSPGAQVIGLSQDKLLYVVSKLTSPLTPPSVLPLLDSFLSSLSSYRLTCYILTSHPLCA